MASARRTGTNENISTYHSAGTGSPDYTSLAAWETATDNNLVTGTVSEVLECAAGTHTDTISMVGATTDATYFRIIRANSSSHHGGVRAAGVVFSSTTDGHMFALADDYFSLQDVCLTQSINSANSRDIVQLSSSADAADVVGCIIYGSSNAGAGHIRPITNGGIAGTSVIDTIIEGNTTGLACITNNQASGTPLLLSNVTISGGTTGVSAVTANLTKCVNVLCDGQTTCFSGTYTSSGSSNNASSDATAPGTSSRTTQTFTFLGGNDYHLSPSDAGAATYGVDPSTYDDDIDLETVTTWNIGADGFAAVAPAAVVPTAGSASYGKCVNIVSATAVPNLSVTEGTSAITAVALTATSGTVMTLTASGSVTLSGNGSNAVTLLTGASEAEYNTVLATLTVKGTTPNTKLTITMIPTDGTLSDNKNFYVLCDPAGVVITGTTANVIASVESVQARMLGGQTNDTVTMTSVDDGGSPQQDESSFSVGLASFFNVANGLIRNIIRRRRK